MGLKGKELAERVGCHPPDISDWEKGKNIPSVESLMKLARALETNETWLVSGNHPKNPHQDYSKITQLPVENAMGDFELTQEASWEAERIKDKNRIIDLQQDKIEGLQEKIRKLEARLADLEGVKENKPSRKEAG